MDPHNSLDNFLDKVDELIRVVKNSKFSEDAVPPEVLEHLKFLEEMVKAMVSANEATLVELGITGSHIHEALEKTKLMASDKRVMNRLEKIKLETEEMQREFAATASISKHARRITGKKKVAARQKKFRPMGGRQDWTPL